MIDLQSIKILLQTAGISRLKIDFDSDHNIINAEYVFKGKSGIKQITYVEIIDSLNIGSPEAPVCPSVGGSK